MPGFHERETGSSYNNLAILFLSNVSSHSLAICYLPFFLVFPFFVLEKRLQIEYKYRNVFTVIFH